MKHWTEYLPEAGRTIEIRAMRITSLVEKIEHAKEQLAALQQERTDSELEVLDLVKTAWSTEEIIMAKRKHFKDLTK